MKNKIIILVTSLTLIAISVIGYVERDLFLSKIKVDKKPEILALTKMPELTFVIRKQMEEGGDIIKNGQVVSGIGQRKIPQLLVLNNNPTYSAANEFLLKETSKNCIDFANSVSVDTAYKRAKEMMASPKIEKETIMADEQKILFVQEAGFYDEWSATTTFLNQNLWSLDIYTSNNCGGAHPNSERYGRTFVLNASSSLGHFISDYSTVKTIELSDIFSNFEMTRKDVYDSIVKNVFEKSESSSDEKCQKEITLRVSDYINRDYDKSYDGPISFNVDKTGINIFSFGLPHAVAGPCEPLGVLIPYSAFGTLIHTEFLQMVGYTNK